MYPSTHIDTYLMMKDVQLYVEKQLRQTFIVEVKPYQEVQL